MMSKMFFAGAFALTLVGFTSYAQFERCPDESVVNASSFGWNAEDATECLQKALDSGASRLVVDRQAGDWIVRPLTLKGRGDMEVVFEDGVVLRAKRGEYKGVGDVMLTVSNCTNLTLRAEGRASFVMQKADYRDGTKYKTAEWRHTLAVYGGAHVRIAGLTFADSGGDGIYVHSVKDIRLENVVSRGHYRQGLSIICVDGFLAQHCLFTETRGAAPQCGVDIEPNNWYEKLSDIVFEDCAFTSNAMAGVSFYVPSRRAKSPAFGVTLRNCRAEGNVQSGFWNVMNGKEPVRGALTLENCVSVGNGGSPFHLQNACATNGIVVRVKGCTFDARGGAHAVAAVYLPSATAWHDFGSVDFSDCAALVDGMPAILFVGRPGIGLTGATGRLFVDRNGERSVLDVADFAKKYPPRPELLKPFRPATLDLSKLTPVSDKSSGGTNGTCFRFNCDFVQYVPEAGEYAIRFRQTRLTPGSTYSWKFTVTDETGKTVDSFDLAKQDVSYAFKPPRSGVYRFKGSGGHSTLNVVSDHPGWGLVAVKGVGLFKGRNHRFFFRMPAGAKEIEIQLSPQEKGSAQLLSPEGKIVADVPVQAIGSIIRHVRTDVSKAETWELRLPYLEEDYGFAIGGDAVPIASMGSPDNVLEVAGETAAGGSVKASSFGWNAEDATECLQKAINSGATEVVVNKMSSAWIVRPIKGVSNQRIVFEPGVEVIAKKGEFKNVGSCLFSWTRCSNVTLSGKGAILRMRKADYLKKPYRPSEWRMCLSFSDCSNITVEGLEIRESGGDGIYLSGGKTGGCRNVTIRDVVSDGNNRQGISVISCDGLTIENSVFRNTSGAPPEAGIDFEPNEPGQFLKNVVVRNCRFENNVGHGIEFALPNFGPMTEPISVLVEDCVTVGNKHGIHFASNSPQHWDEVTGRATFRRCDFLDAVKDPLTITKKKDGGVTLAFESCRVQAAGDPAPRTLTEEAWRSVVKSATFLGGPFEAKPVEPDYSQYEAVDAHPGELLPLPVAYERFHCRFVFYADRARTVRFKGRAGAVGPRGKLPTDVLEVEDLRGRKVGEIPMPGAAETEISCAVPAAGFYQISSRLGVYGIFALTAADAPVAIDLGSHACLVRPHGRFYFGVEDGRAPTEIGFSAREEAKVGVSIADPDGKTVHADKRLCGSYYLALERPRRTGLWSIDYAHGRAECSFSMKGAPSWLFFSKDRCWRRKTSSPDAGLAPMICPAARQMTLNDRSYVPLDGSVPLIVASADGAAATWVAERFKRWFGKRLDVGTGPFARDTERAEAYSLSIAKDRIELSSATLAGIRHAAHSLRQLAIPARGTLKVAHYIVPEAEIADEPDLKFRALHFCWFPETKTEEVERFVRLAGYLKYNYVLLESWGTYRSERFPWLGWPDAPMTKETLARLRGIAADEGVTLVPAVNVFGHASHSQGATGKHATLDFAPEYQPLFEPVMGWNWCLSNPETRRVLSEYVAEMHEAYGSPPFFHLGCDEANPPSCPECRTGVYADKVVAHIKAMAEVLKKRGARAMIWHDMFLAKDDSKWKGDYANGSALMAAKLGDLPRSVVLCVWNYHDPRKDGTYPSFGYFKGLGFDVVTCPYDKTETIDAQGKAARADGIFGFLGTTWLYPEGVAFSRLMIHDACAAWGGDAKAFSDPWNARFLTLLRHVCWDMSITDRTLTGVYRYQYHPYGGTKDSK